MWAFLEHLWDDMKKNIVMFLKCLPCCDYLFECVISVSSSFIWIKIRKHNVQQKRQTKKTSKFNCPSEAKLIQLDIFGTAIWNLIRTSVFLYKNLLRMLWLFQPRASHVYVWNNSGRFFRSPNYNHKISNLMALLKSFFFTMQFSLLKPTSCSVSSSQEQNWVRTVFCI